MLYLNYKINFFIQALTEKKERKEKRKKKKKRPKVKEKIQQGSTRMAIIVQCIRCVIWELNPPHCKAAYTLFSAEGLTFSKQVLIFNVLILGALSTSWSCTFIYVKLSLCRS
jgi:hypothetical protein